MMAITKLLAGGAAMAALAGTAPAAAQYYPGYGYGYGSSPGVVVDRVLNDVMGAGSYGYGGYGGYGLNSQAVVNMCVNTIQARLGGGYGAYGGYGYGAYGYGGGGRVLGISRVEPRSTGGIRVRGVATSGMNAGYGYGYTQRPDLTWKCSVDLRGAIVGLDIQRAYPNYSEAYTPWGNYDYSQYGYRRY